DLTVRTETNVTAITGATTVDEYLRLTTAPFDYHVADLGVLVRQLAEGSRLELFELGQRGRFRVEQPGLQSLFVSGTQALRSRRTHVSRSVHVTIDVAGVLGALSFQRRMSVVEGQSSGCKFTRPQSLL